MSTKVWVDAVIQLAHDLGDESWFVLKEYFEGYRTTQLNDLLQNEYAPTDKKEVHRQNLNVAAQYVLQTISDAQIGLEVETQYTKEQAELAQVSTLVTEATVKSNLIEALCELDPPPLRK